MDEQIQVIHNPEQTYNSIRQSIVQAQHTMAAAVNSAMVTAYWEIGEQIYKACGENDRAAYGKSFCSFCPNSLLPNLDRDILFVTFGPCVSFTVASQFGTHCVPN